MLAAGGVAAARKHEAIVDALNAQTMEMELLVPYERGDVVAAVHRAGNVIEQDHADGGTSLRVRLPSADAYQFSEFTV